MNSTKRMSTQLQEFLAAPVSKLSQADTYGGRGFWSPGVRLMRQLNFAKKALVITCFFLLPVILLGHFYLSGQRDQIAFSTAEREGVVALRHFLPMYSGILKMRSASSAAVDGFKAAVHYKAGRDQTEHAIAEFEKYLEASGDPIGLSADYDKFKSAWTAYVSLNTNVGDAAGSSAFSSMLAQVVTLLTSIGDKSNLVLDPDVDSFYMINTMVLTMPQMMDDMAQMWGWSTYFLASAKTMQKEISSKDMNRYAAWLAGSEVGMKQSKAFLSRTYSANPDVESRLDMTVFDELALFVKLAKDPESLVAQDALSAEKFYETGSVALSRLMSFYDQGLPVLDTLLEARIRTIQTRVYFISIAVFLALLTAAYFFYCFVLVTHHGLQLIRHHLAEIASGDLRKPPAAPLGTDEAAQVIADLITCYDALYALIRKVRHSARALHSASEEIASASVDLSSRTEEAGATLEQQASSMSDISSTVKATAERALMAATFANDNAHVAEKGGQVFQDVVHTMRDIQASSTQIGDIVGTIDGLAFQTNILALNAAVEAARAGESGRGFAVVATEVRSLAQRSATAARQIRALIEASVQKVQDGTKVVADAGQSMTEVVINARQINTFLGEISSAAQEQAQDVMQVGQAIQELDNNTQQNAALVEETTAAAGALKAQAEALQEEISNFRVA